MKAFALAAMTLVLAGCARELKDDSRVVPPEVKSPTLDPALAARIEQARRAVLGAPDSGALWGNLGQALHAAEFQAEARICYERAAELESGDGRWAYLLGLLQLQDDPELAVANLRRAMNLLPASEAPRLRLAKALVERGRGAEAASLLEEWLRRAPDHAGARLELARIQFNAGEIVAAAKLLQPCLTNAYTQRAAYLLLGQVQQRTGDSNGAALLARRAEAMRPQDWPDPILREVQRLEVGRGSLAERANFLIMQRRFDEAENLLRQLLERAPGEPEALLLLGRLQLQQRRCAEAEQTFLLHLQAQTNSLQGFVQLGLARYCEGRWSAAADAFRTAVALKPDFAQAHYNLGLALAREKKPEEAIAAFRQALRCQPGDANAHAALAEELWRTGEAGEALEEAEAALRLNPAHPVALRVRQELKR